MTQKAQTPRRSSRRRAWIPLAGVAALVGGYFGVMAVIRAHVSGVIQERVGQPLPDFELTDRDGRTWRSAELRGRKVVLNFFRSRCSSCTAEAPAIRALAAELDPDEVVLLGVMTDAVVGFPADESAETLRRKEFRHPVLMADAAFMEALHSVRWSHVTPVTYLIDVKGSIVAALRGAQELSSLRAALRAID